MSRSWRMLAGLALAAVALAGWLGRAATGATADDPLEVLVTSAGDGAATASDCPDEGKCTLRAAILHVNADASPGAYVIRFDPELFTAGAPTTIALATEPLPPITRPDVQVDARGALAVVDGALLEGESDGLVLQGANARVSGLSVRAFGGACLAVEGAGAVIEDTAAGDCPTGIRIRGAGATAHRNLVGFQADGSPAPVTTGIRVAAAGAILGAAAGESGDGNVIGNAATAIAIGDGASGSTFSGTLVAGNTIGRSPQGADAPVSTGVQVLPPSWAATIRENHIAGTTIAGIQVITGTAEPAVVGNRLTGNTFALASGLAIDLGADGVRNPNDPGDADDGPNLRQNHPAFTRPAQATIVGVVPGCEGCAVELYRAHHEPGGEADYGSEPIPVPPAITDADGTFSFAAPPVAPGTWITAIATDPGGNSSEFGPSARVGGGAAQCGNLTLQPGWNLAGYFFPAPLTLGAAFPPGEDTVSAIYRLDDGAGTYAGWFEGTTAGRTLTTLSPGESYWFYAERETTLASGFALAVPVPVQLAAGWNDFVYIGGEGDIRDAFASIAGRYTVAYRYVNDGDSGRWERYAPGAPGWVQDFTTVEACTAYVVLMDEPATLLPLQP